MNSRHKFEGPEMEFARSVKAAVLGAVAVGILLIAAGTQGGAGVVGDATAAAQPAQATRYEYFPANFPAPEGPVEPHIEAF
ncbi:MAG TPA: hypothetical protein VML91_10270 [Burkholderiales bacterium]|nr:hypothetical protein [Burkholderiales bacterium]